MRPPYGWLESRFCEEFEGHLPSDFDREKRPELLWRIVQLRSYARMRDAMRTEKERERDAKPHGPVAELVAKVQHIVQQDPDDDDEDEDEDEKVEGR